MLSHSFFVIVAFIILLVVFIMQIIRIGGFGAAFVGIPTIEKGYFYSGKLAILFTWAFARRAWREQVSRLAAWILFLYPEAILLGSSQMREAFLVTLIIAAFYGLLRYERDRSLTGLAWMLAPLALCLPFSPPVAALALAALVFLAVVLLIRAYRPLATPLRVAWALAFMALWYSLLLGQLYALLLLISVIA